MSGRTADGDAAIAAAEAEAAEAWRDAVACSESWGPADTDRAERRWHDAELMLEGLREEFA